MNDNKIDLNSFLIVFIFSLSIFLWSFNPLTLNVIQTIKDILQLEPPDVDYVNIRNSDGIQFRFLYLVLLIKLSYDFFYKKEKINFTLLTWCLCFFLIIFIINFKSIIINPNLIYANIVAFLTIIIVSYYWRYLKNIDYLIGTFIVCFVISIITTGDFLYPHIGMPHIDSMWIDKCGGVTHSFLPTFFQDQSLLPKKILTTFNEESILQAEFLQMINRFKLTFSEILFKENSHLSILAPSIILYSIYKILNEKNFFIVSILILFIFLLYLKSTTIFFAGIILNFIIIYIFNSKKFNKKTTTVYFLFIFALSYNFISDYACQKRFLPLKTYSINAVNELSTKIPNIFLKKNINIKKNIIETDIYTNFRHCLRDKDWLETQGDFTRECNLEELQGKKPNPKNDVSVSTAVLIVAAEVAIRSLKEKPFGWGFNNYVQARAYFDNKNYLTSFKDSPNYPLIRKLNRSDASSIFVKMIVEIGLFSLIVFVILFLYLLSNKIPIEEKLFYLPLIFTQVLRGVGYFNSGFLIILIFITLSYFNRNN